MKKARLGESFGRRLRDCREEKGYSQRDLANAIGASPRMIVRYEYNQVKPSIEVALKFARALNVSVSYLLGEIRFSSSIERSSKLFQQLHMVSDDEREKIYVAFESLIKRALSKTDMGTD